MATLKKKPNDVLNLLGDTKLPMENFRHVLLHLAGDTSEEGNKVLAMFRDTFAAGKGNEGLTQKMKELDELMEEMRNGALRSATFWKGMQPPGMQPRAHVLMQDGTEAFCIVPDPKLNGELECGDTVLLEASGRAVLFRDEMIPDAGEEARLERRIDTDHVEVTLRGEMDRFVFRMSKSLARKMDDEEVPNGSTLLVCTRRLMAFNVVPQQDGVSHFRYLVKDKPPEISIERDIGSPPKFLNEILEHVKLQMLDPELGQLYRMRPCLMKLLTGVSGSGKTLCVQGLIRAVYELMSDITGVPVDMLPPRVMRLRASEVLSKWLGESDKQLDRFFDELEQLADEKFIAPDGQEYTLPVIGIGEEIDSLARTRGSDVEGVYDRIQTTALQRLDTTSQKLRNKHILLLFTSNVPHLIDPAFLRRAGGTIERFGRLTQKSFVAVLSKHVRGLPIQGENGDGTAANRRLINSTSAWLFSPRGSDQGQVELNYVGNTTPIIKYRRDFLTGAMVDRAVQQAAAEACRLHRQGTDNPGISASMVIRSFDGQIRSIVDQLHVHNVGNYMTLPDGVRVASVRRIDQPSILPFELERAV